MQTHIMTRKARELVRRKERHRHRWIARQADYGFTKSELYVVEGDSATAVLQKAVAIHSRRYFRCAAKIINGKAPSTTGC